jgi:hypothetical protein
MAAPGAFSSEVDAGSPWKMRPKKDLECFPIPLDREAL